MDEGKECPHHSTKGLYTSLDPDSKHFAFLRDELNLQHYRIQPLIVVNIISSNLYRAFVRRCNKRSSAALAKVCKF